MKNNPHTQERSPVLSASPPPTSHQQQKSPLLANHPWLLVVGVGILSIAIATVAIFSLTSTGRVENPTKQTTTPTQFATPDNRSNSSPNWLLTIVLLGASTASAVAIYKWREHLPNLPKRGLSRRQQRKLLLQQGQNAKARAIETPIATEDTALNADLETLLELLEDQPVEPVVMDVTPTISVLPPEDAQPNNLGGQSLAEMMDIRKHLSLGAILQDFKRPD